MSRIFSSIMNDDHEKNLSHLRSGPMTESILKKGFGGYGGLEKKELKICGH